MCKPLTTLKKYKPMTCCGYDRKPKACTAGSQQRTSQLDHFRYVNSGTLRLSWIAIVLLSTAAIASSTGAQPLEAIQSKNGGETVAVRPIVAYLDINSGPIRGGEHDKGVYLSIFGRNFGELGPRRRTSVRIGGVEVDNYRYLGPSRGRTDITQLTVQVGKLGDPQPGIPLPVEVVVDGIASNSNYSFTVQPGDVLFVDNVAGDDRTATKNDITKPWRHVQTAAGAGALEQAHPGDVLVLRGKAVWSDAGRNGRWFRFRRTHGSRPTGAPGNGYIAILAYPGEAVRFHPPQGSQGGIHGIDAIEFPGMSQWIVISGLILEGGDRTVQDGPINLQVQSDHWRIVNNEIGPWDAENGTRSREAHSGGIAGNGSDVAILGNHIHDIGGNTLNHCIYMDSGSKDVEIAFNHIHGCSGGNIIQLYDNLGGHALSGVSIHHNLLHDGGRYGLNIADGTQSALVWNNVMFNTALASIRLNVAPLGAGQFLISYNTFAGANQVNQSSNGALLNTWKTGNWTSFVRNTVAITPGSFTQMLFANEGLGTPNFFGNIWLLPRGRRYQMPGTNDSLQLLPAGFDVRALGHLPCVSMQPASAIQARVPIDGALADDFALNPRRNAASAGAFACMSEKNGDPGPT
jgi:hypothetical protein